MNSLHHRQRQNPSLPYLSYFFSKPYQKSPEIELQTNSKFVYQIMTISTSLDWKVYLIQKKFDREYDTKDRTIFNLTKHISLTYKFFPNKFIPFEMIWYWQTKWLIVFGNKLFECLKTTFFKKGFTCFGRFRNIILYLKLVWITWNQESRCKLGSILI